jgi:hypothetical protein
MRRGLRLDEGLGAGQIAVDEGDGHGAFAYGGGAAFYGAVADVAGCEYAGYAGFHVIRVAIQDPSGWALAVFEEIEAGDQVALLVANYSYIRCPLGAWEAA